MNKARRCWPLYARFLRLIADGATGRELSDKLGVTFISANRIVSIMHTLKLVHIGEWVERGRGLAVARWMLGPGPDAERPLCKTTGKPSRRIHVVAKLRPEMIGFASLIRALDEPLTVKAIIEATGSGGTQVNGFIRVAKRLRLVFIADWQCRECGGSPAPLYQLGVNRPDAARPARMSRRLVEQRYRQGKKAKAEILTVLRALSVNSSVFRHAA